MNSQMGFCNHNETGNAMRSEPMKIMLNDCHLAILRNVQHLRFDGSYIVKQLRITFIHLNQEVMSQYIAHRYFQCELSLLLAYSQRGLLLCYSVESVICRNC